MKHLTAWVLSVTMFQVAAASQATVVEVACANESADRAIGRMYWALAQGDERAVQACARYVRTHGLSEVGELDDPGTGLSPTMIYADVVELEKFPHGLRRGWPRLSALLRGTDHVGLLGLRHAYTLATLRAAQALPVSASRLDVEVKLHYASGDPVAAAGALLELLRRFGASEIALRWREALDGWAKSRMGASASAFQQLLDCAATGRDDDALKPLGGYVHAWPVQPYRSAVDCESILANLLDGYLAGGHMRLPRYYPSE